MYRVPTCTGRKRDPIDLTVCLREVPGFTGRFPMDAWAGTRVGALRGVNYQEPCNYEVREHLTATGESKVSIR